MRKLLHSVLIFAALCATTQAFAASATDFYLTLLRRGTAEVQAGRNEAALNPLRLAAFGLLESIEHYETAQTYLAVASSRLGQQDRAREAAQRIIAAERIERKFAALGLPPEIRNEFNGIARRLLSTVDAALLTAPPAPAPERPAPTATTATTITPPRNVPAPAPATTTPATTAPAATTPATATPATTTAATTTPATTTPATTTPATTAPATTAPATRTPATTTPATTTPATTQRTVTAPAQTQTPNTVPAPAQAQPQTQTPNTVPAPAQTQPQTQPARVEPPRPAPAPVPAQTQTPRVDVRGALAAGERALASADLEAARRAYRALLDQPGIDRATWIRVAEGLYRARDFAGTLTAFDRLGRLARDEEPYRYYLAVALYETGAYAQAKRELAAALPHIEETPDVTRYRAKIENAR